MVSAGSAGLFHRAIIQSGAYQLITPTLAASEALGIDFANKVGCDDQSAACLRSKSTTELLTNGGSAFNQSTVDGQVLPQSQVAALFTGQINRVPVMQGANSHEGRFFIPTGLSDAQYLGIVAQIALATGKDVDQILATYPNVTLFEVASSAFGDVAFACTARLSNQLLSQAVRTYAYEFEDPVASPLGAMHTAELRYLFNLNLGGSPLGPRS